LGVRLTTSSCKKKFVENLLREKNARRGQGSMGCGVTDDDDDPSSLICHPIIYVIQINLIIEKAS
jgi:hypothetical protein